MFNMYQEVAVWKVDVLVVFHGKEFGLTPTLNLAQSNRTHYKCQINGNWKWIDWTFCPDHCFYIIKPKICNISNKENSSRYFGDSYPTTKIGESGASRTPGQVEPSAIIRLLWCNKTIWLYNLLTQLPPNI